MGARTTTTVLPGSVWYLREMWTFGIVVIRASIARPLLGRVFSGVRPLLITKTYRESFISALTAPQPPMDLQTTAIAVVKTLEYPY